MSNHLYIIISVHISSALFTSDTILYSLLSYCLFDFCPILVCYIVENIENYYNQTHELFILQLSLSQLICFVKQKSQDTLTILATKREKRLLYQLFVKNINIKLSKVLLTKK